MASNRVAVVSSSSSSVITELSLLHIDFYICLILFPQSWSSDIVEPFDFEDFLSQYQLLIDRDPLRAILDVPAGDVEVEITQRPIRTLQPILPEESMY